MKFHYAGKYDGNESKLPSREHPEGYIQFKEFNNFTAFAVFMNVMSLVILILFAVIIFLRIPEKSWELITRRTLVVVFILFELFPHEILHALCFKKDVYMYTNWSKMMLFVVGTEDMSRSRFVFMSMLPNLIFGFIPFIIFLFIPSLLELGILGACAIGMGAGDYYNVFNCLTQVPRGAKVYMSGLHSYWYK